MAIKEYVKYDKEGQPWVGVLVSAGYGAGWSTWNSYKGEGEFDLALDHRIIEWLIANATVTTCEAPEGPWNIEDIDEAALKEYCASIGYNDVYCGGADGLYIDWYEKGTLIRIEEYDGYESVITGNTLTEL